MMQQLQKHSLSTSNLMTLRKCLRNMALQHTKQMIFPKQMIKMQKQQKKQMTQKQMLRQRQQRKLNKNE